MNVIFLIAQLKAAFSCIMTIKNFLNDTGRLVSFEVPPPMYQYIELLRSTGIEQQIG